MYDHNDNKELRNLCVQRLDRIITHFINMSDPDYDEGLYTGGSGVALLFAQYYLWSKDKKVLNKLHNHIEAISKQIHSQDYPSAIFSSGIAGFGWLITYLSDKNLLDITDDYFDDFDNYLRRAMQYLCINEKFDQMHGMIGIARYFLKRGSVDDIVFSLDAIAEHVEQDGAEYRWARKDVSPLSYDFGLAHGVAGVLYFLGKCYELGVKPDLCERIGNGILEFYNNNESCDPDTSSYPYFMLVSGYKPASKSEKVRHGWCYGDLCILQSMCQYAARIGNTVLQKEILGKLNAISKCRSLGDAQVRDAIICHGSSGLMLMYNRLFHATNLPEFSVAAKYWTEVTISMGGNDNSSSGYAFSHDGKNKITSEIEERDSLLEGVCGVGLAYLSLLDPHNMDWDECLMLS